MKPFRAPQCDSEMFEPSEATHVFAATNPIERPGIRVHTATNGFGALQCDPRTFEQRQAIHAFAQRCQTLALVIAGPDRTQLEASIVQLGIDIPLVASSTHKAILASILMSIIIKLAST